MHKYGTTETLDKLKDGKDAVGLTCTACHGGNPVPRKTSDDPKSIQQIKGEAHVRARFPAQWQREGKYTGANPERTNTLLARESWEFVRFVNPGDLRVAAKTCGGSACHDVESKNVARSMMTHGAMLWGAALYNNGSFPLKDARFGESYSENGAPQSLIQTPKPTLKTDARKVCSNFSIRSRAGKFHNPEMCCAFLNVAENGVWKSGCRTKRKIRANRIRDLARVVLVLRNAPIPCFSDCRRHASSIPR